MAQKLIDGGWFSIANTAGILVLFALLFAARKLYDAYATPLRRVPGPWWAKFTRLWHVKAVASRSFEKINIDLHRKYGPVVRLAPNEYSIDDPDAAKVIYRQKDQLPKSPRYSTWGLPSGEPNLFTHTSIQHHAERRREVNQLYSMSALSNVEYRIDSNLAAFIEKMGAFADSRDVVDMALWLQCYTFDTIGTLSFGKPFGFLQKGADIADIMATIHNYSRYGTIIGPCWQWHPLVFQLLQLTAPSGAVGIAYIQQFAAMTMDSIQKENKLAGYDEKIGEGEALRSDYMSSLLARHRRDPAAFKIDDITYHMVPNIIAGGETTGSSITAAVYFLCKHPTVFAQLRQELDLFMIERQSDDPITMRDAQGCGYLQAFVKEALRLFPAAGLTMPRVIPKGGLTLAGHFFPEGSIVGVNAWVAHANRSVFGPDADEFRPERWLQDQESSTRMDQYFFTFGRGPRTCIGKNISLMELSKLIAELVLRFDLAFADPSKEWKVYNDWFMKQENFNVVVTRRK